MKLDTDKAKHFLCSFFLGALALSLFSIPQKYILGADPFAFKGFIVPVLFGGSIGVILAIALRRNRKQNILSQKAMLESEERFRTLFEKAPIAMAYISMEGQIIDLNDLLHEMMGYETEDVPTLEDAWTQAMPDPDLRERVSSKWLADLEQAVTNNSAIESFECPLVYKDGSQHIAVIGTKLIGENILVSFLDITESKRTADAIDFERRQLLSIFNGMNELIYVSDPETHELLFVNQHLGNLIGENQIGTLCYRTFEGREQPCDFCTNPIILNNTGKPYFWEYRNPKMNKDLSIVDQIIRWPDDRDVRLSMAVDITEKKKAEEALRDSESRLRSIFEVMTDSIMILDAEGQIQEFVHIANKHLFNLPQNEIDELLHTPFQDAFSPQKTAEFQEAVRNTLSLDKPTSIKFELTVAGHELCFEGVFSPLSSNRVVMVIRNITDRKKADKALQESERRFRQIFLASPESIVLSRLEDDLIVDINDSHTLITGYTREDVVGKTTMEAGIWQEAAERTELADQLRETGLSVNKEVPFKRKDGTIGIGLSSFRLIYLKNIPHILTISRDITDQKREQEEKEKFAGSTSTIPKNGNHRYVGWWNSS